MAKYNIYNFIGDPYFSHGEIWKWFCLRDRRRAVPRRLSRARIMNERRRGHCANESSIQRQLNPADNKTVGPDEPCLSGMQRDN